MAKAKKAGVAPKNTKKVSKKKTTGSETPSVNAPQSTPLTVEPRPIIPGATKIRRYQHETVLEISRGESKEAVVGASTEFFEAVMKTLFAAGFDIGELDPVLEATPLENLPYGTFFMRLGHKNLDKLGEKNYVVNLFLIITGDYNRNVVAKYCVYFPETQTTILMPTNVRADWNFNWNQKKSGDWYSMIEPKISNFLEKIPVLMSFIERMKAQKSDPKLVEKLKKDIVEEFMNPSRINGRKFLWSKSDKVEFDQRPIYPKEVNLFEAVANVVSLFTAQTPVHIRLTTSKRTGKEYIRYAYCEPEVWEKKNGKLAKNDIQEGKLAVPVAFSRRTYYTFSNITDSVNKYLDSSAIKLSQFSL